ncbi:MAG: gliding motility-associated C-terminal domain-containing protein, partial [Bacteroidales bacterium]|nr:gliding motility-associated C-terminal domain-containing protein [Bacteroidales bacterium]
FLGRVSGINNVIKKVVFDDYGILSGQNNKVDTVEMKDVGFVKGTNIIDILNFHSKGVMAMENNINIATFAANGEIFGKNIFNTLKFSAGFFYLLEHDSVQTIVNEFMIMGECEAPIMITSDVNTVQAIIHKENGGLTTEYLALRDIKASGPGIPFIANISVDLGNNTNWNIETTGSKDLYWVDGKGEWDDRYHWSDVSGGVGGECPPTAIDNAYFDENSFSNPNDTVTINCKYAICKDIDWTGSPFNPLFTGPDTNNLRVYGSLTFIENMAMDFGGQVYFEAETTGQTITMAEQEFYNNVFIQGRNGGWTLMDNFKTIDTMYFLHGSLNTNDVEIFCKNFNSADTTTRTLLLGKSTITVFQSKADAWWLSGANLIFDGDESLIISLADEGHVRTDNAFELVYNNIEIHGKKGKLKNNAYCIYNLVDLYNVANEVKGNCVIDTLSFHGPAGKVLDSDIIKTVMCHGLWDTIAGGTHNIEIVHFFKDGFIYGLNNIDTAIFYNNGIITQINTFDTVAFLGNGEIYGRNTFNNLSFSPGKAYLFEYDSTQTIVDGFYANGSCTGSIIIQSDFDGKQASIRKINNDVELEYVSLRDMNAIGSNITFTANSSVDLGNNTNWTINMADPLGLYWVNGQGNWDDPYHWAATSGGVGDYCLPTAIDDVYFDENSFFNYSDTVLLNVGNAVCRNMDWTGSEVLMPVFFGPDTNNLRIYGSLTFNNGMSMEFKGKTYFEELIQDKGKSENDSIKSAGRAFKNNVYFQGRSGSWKFLDEFSVNGNISLIHGTLETNGNDMFCKRFFSDYTNIRSLNISNSTIILNDVEAWLINATNLNFKADSSLIISNSSEGNIRTKNGEMLTYNNIKIYGVNTGIYNNDCINTNYNIVTFYGDFGLIRGENCDYTVDSILFHAQGGIIQDNAKIYMALFYEPNCRIDGTHTIDTAIFYASGKIWGKNFIHSATFMYDGELKDDNTFDNLTFSPGGEYTLQDDKIQTVNDEFIVRGNNCFIIHIHSDTDGSQAEIYKTSGIVSGDHLEIKDINAYGGAEFYAGGLSEDQGGNSGWIFENAPGYIYGLVDDFTACYNEEVTIIPNITSDTNFTNYYWIDILTSDTLSKFATYSYTATNQQTIVLCVEFANNCPYTDTITVDVFPQIQDPFQGPYDVCEGDQIQIDLTGFIEYLWHDGSEEPYFIADQTGPIWVEVTDTNNCSDIFDSYIDVTPTPVPYLGEDITLNFGEHITLDAGYPGSDFLWTCDEQTIIINNPNNQIITVPGTEDGVEYMVEVTYKGCVGNDTIKIYEYPFCILDVPTAFSPNKDRINDTLFVKGSGCAEVELIIFNRYGEMVFKTNDIEKGWDGTFNEIKQEKEVYIYYLKGVCFDGKNIVKKGNITLLR